MWLIDLVLARLVPVMVTRMIISLKKAASSRQPHLDLGVSTGLQMDLQGVYSPHAVDSIPLSVFRDQRPSH